MSSVLAAIRHHGASPTTETSVDVLNQLAKLGALHRDGVLSDDEFVEAKRTLLGQL